MINWLTSTTTIYICSALHISKNQPCTSNAFCGEFKKSFRGTICGLLTDLDPSMSGPNSKIATYLSTSVAVFSFQNIVYYNSTAFVSFHISIYPDRYSIKYFLLSILIEIIICFLNIATNSRVEIAYDHVSYVFRKSKQIFPTPGYWITGLRPPTENLQNIVYTATDLSITQRYWSYSSPGKIWKYLIFFLFSIIKPSIPYRSVSSREYCADGKWLYCLSDFICVVFIALTRWYLCTR